MTSTRLPLAASARAIDRRRFLFATATGLLAAGTGVRSAAAATDDDLAFANFGLASSYLLADFYGAGARVGPARCRGAADAATRAIGLDAPGARADRPAHRRGGHAGDRRTTSTFEWPAAALATAAATGGPA